MPQFEPGNEFGKKPSRAAAKMKKMRGLLVEATSEEQLMAIWAIILTKAENGDMKAIGIFFERILGPVVDVSTEARIEELEERIEKLINERQTAAA